MQISRTVSERNLFRLSLGLAPSNETVRGEAPLRDAVKEWNGDELEEAREKAGNGTLRSECLDAQWFALLAEADHNFGCHVMNCAVLGSRSQLMC